MINHIIREFTNEWKNRISLDMTGWGGDALGIVQENEI